MNIYFCTEVTLNKRAVYVRSPTPVSSQCDSGFLDFVGPFCTDCVFTYCPYLFPTSSQFHLRYK